MPKPEIEEKPIRLYFKSYLKIIKNAIGSKMFRNFYAKTSTKGEFDAFNDGEYSCAFFVSTILVIFKKISGFHGLVSHTVEDMEKSGWQKVDEHRPGDVVVWEPIDFGNGPVPHIGFAIGNDQAVSTSWKQKCVIEHGINFNGNRKIEAIYRYSDWEPHGS